MFKSFIILIIILFQIVLAQTVTTYGNLLRIRFDQTEIDPTDTLGSWEKWKSQYQRAFTIDDCLFLQKKTEGTLPYQYNPGYINYTIEIPATGEEKSFYFSVLVDGPLTYFNQNLGTPQLIKTEKGVWIFNDILGCAFVNNNKEIVNLSEIQAIYSPLWKIGNVGSQSLMANDYYSGKCLLTELGDEKSFHSDSLKIINLENYMPPKFLFEFEENLILTADYNNIFLAEIKDSLLILNKVINSFDRILDLYKLDNSLYIFGNRGLEKYRLNYEDTSLVFKEWLLTFDVENYHFENNYQFSGDYSYLTFLSADTLYLFDTSKESIINKWCTINLEEAMSPIIDSPYVYIHQATKYVSTEEPGYTLPQKFDLEAYPNPFNPATTINFSLPEFSQVQIKIFNALGEELEVLLNEEKPAGNYKIKFDAQNFSSGIYFVVLKTGKIQITKKLMLLK